MADLPFFVELNEQNLTEKEKVFKKLNGNDYWNFMNLSDHEYKDCVQKLIDFIDRDEIELSEYITVFYYIIRFDNPLNPRYLIPA